MRSRWPSVMAVWLATQAALHAPPTPAAVQAEAAAAFQCPVTLPSPNAARHQNDALATGLYPEGKVVFKPGGPGRVYEDGSLSMKFFWWRLRPGQLTFTGKRLDASAPPLRAVVPEGYGPKGFQAVGLIFPTIGCWQVTGKLGDDSLTFVTLVELIADGPCGKEAVGPNELLGRLQTTDWKEVPAPVVQRNALIRVTGQRSYEGGLDGESTVDYLLVQLSDRSATFSGYEFVRGKVKGVSGTFVAQHTGRIEDGIARSTWLIVPHSGTGGLKELGGRGTFSSGLDEFACYTLNATGL